MQLRQSHRGATKIFLFNNRTLKRRAKKNKNKHWHIDYITTLNTASIDRVFIIERLSKKIECILVDKLKREFRLNDSIENFGNSDCKNCSSHLLYSETKLNYNHLCSLYQSTVLFIPSSKDIC